MGSSLFISESSYGNEISSHHTFMCCSYDGRARFVHRIILEVVDKSGGDSLFEFRIRK